MKTWIQLSLYTLLFASVAGCAFTPDYYPDNEQPVQGAENRTASPGFATLEFTTNTFESTSFTQQQGEDLCKPTERKLAAMVNKKRHLSTAERSANGLGSILTFGLTDKLNASYVNSPHTSVQKFKANTPVILNAESQLNDGRTVTKCGPVFVKFIPEDQKRYRVEFLRSQNTCGMAITELKTDSLVTRTPHSRWTCSKGFFGIGGDQIEGLVEIK